MQTDCFGHDVNISKQQMLAVVNFKFQSVKDFCVRVDS